jgi:hypothetical protein
MVVISCADILGNVLRQSHTRVVMDVKQARELTCGSPGWSSRVRRRGVLPLDTCPWRAEIRRG